ncbi:DUF397 domain-containing protein [Streptomyces sp. GB4-14]|uniref:DUF397 domain-containing protein n=1 Tax=Streptomyces sp. GB4-14 TaxID=2498703 RepID=UPI003FD55966|nr:DUF397 domain-containing protein [Streptomyces sp. GB4-14]
MRRTSAGAVISYSARTVLPGPSGRGRQSQRAAGAATRRRPGRFHRRRGFRAQGRPAGLGPARPGCRRPRRGRWRSGVRWGGGRDECAEVAAATAGAHIRDSKNAAGPVVTVSRDAWAGFLGLLASSERSV